MKKALLTILGILPLLFLVSIPPVLAIEADPPVIKETEAVKQLGNLPAFFTENRGQTAEEVRYYFKGNDTVYFTDGGIVFQKMAGTAVTLSEAKGLGNRGQAVGDGVVNVGATRRVAQDSRDRSAFGGSEDRRDRALSASGGHQALAYKLEFVGANPTSPQARNALEGKVNYFIGNDPSKWHTDINTYQEIVYPGLYTCHSERSEESRPFAIAQGDTNGSIDLVYKGVPGGMKYEFIVRPGPIQTI